MSDRLFFPVAAAAAFLMIVLATVWPQGEGRRSPGPFGHATTGRAIGAPVLRSPTGSRPSGRP